MSDKLSKIDPQVNSLARPEASCLIAARNEIQRNGAARVLFDQARTEDWDPKRLVEALQPVVEPVLDFELYDIAQALLYLADEYTQLGEGALIVSSATGKAVAKITEEDVWTPPPVPREGGGMAQPLPRLRPDLEGFLVEWVFNQEREQGLLSKLSRRVSQTALLREEGDPRLLVVTRGGRKQIAAEIEEELPRLLTEHCHGVVRNFISHFEMREEAPTDRVLKPLLRCTGFARSRVPIQDPSTFNFRHDHFTAICGRLAVQWVRDIARTLAVSAHTVKPHSVLFDQIGEIAVEGETYWIGPADVAKEFRERVQKHALPVEGVPLTGLSGVVGALVVDPASYRCSSREFLDRWEVAASFEYTLWVDWSKVRSFEVLGVPHTASIVGSY
jgi:hypothetical protein